MKALRPEQFEALLPNFKEISTTPPAKPKVSVRILAYNHSEFIAQAIEGALMQQTNFEFELVIGEDCSTDGTRELVLNYQQKHPDRIRLILAEENGGKYTGNGRLNFVRTLQACRGEYIALLDGDDYWTSPHKLQFQADCLDSHPEYAECGHQATILAYPERKEVGFYGPDIRTQESSFGYSEILEANFIATSSVMFRREFIQNLPKAIYFLPMADWPLHCLLASQGRIGWSYEPMGVYRHHPNAIWSSMGQIDIWKRIVYMYEVYLTYMDPAYHSLIKAKISDWAFKIGLEHLKNADHAQAKLFLAKCLRANPLGCSAPKLEIIKVSLRTFIPSFFWFLSAAKQLIRRGSSRDQLGGAKDNPSPSNPPAGTD